MIERNGGHYITNVAYINVSCICPKPLTVNIEYLRPYLDVRIFTFSDLKDLISRLTFFLQF